MSEDKLSAECYTWFHNTYPQYRDLLWHVPNGGARNKIEAAKFKAMGVRPGIPDYNMLFMGTLHEIELKVGDNTQSPEQTHIMHLHRQHGAIYYLCYTLEQFKTIIKNIINNG